MFMVIDGKRRRRGRFGRKLGVEYFKCFPELSQFALDNIHVNALVSLMKKYFKCGLEFLIALI